MANEQIDPPKKRTELLQELLETMTENVYFQPPPNFQMQYPCIVFRRDRARTLYANNLPYRHTKGYQVTVIDRNPESEIPDKVAGLPLCSFDRHFSADNLNHDVYTLYF